MRILVTGSTGFVGRNLVPVLLNKGHEVLELTRNTSKSTELYGNYTQKHLLDNNQDNLIKCIASFKPEIVIHLASYLTAADDFQSLNKLLDSNIVFFCKLLDALKTVPIKLFINTGTFAEYHKGDGVLDPAYLYAASKTAARSFLDYYSKLGGYKQATVIPYTIYGAKDTQKKIIDLIYDSIYSPLPVDLSPGEQVLDFIHIDDVTSFYIYLIENQENIPNKFDYHLGYGMGNTIKQVAAAIEKVTGMQTNINWGGKPYRTTDVMHAVAKNATSPYGFNFKPKIGLEEGIRKYLKNQYKSNS